MAKKTPSLAVGRGEKLPVSKGAGLTAKGRAKYNAATGSNLKAPQPQGGKRKGGAAGAIGLAQFANASKGDANALMVMGAVMLGAVGLIAGLWADKFDQMSSFQNFLITPMTFLSGVFYSIHSLPPFWQQVSHLNPFFYMIDGFRYGFFGVSDVSPWISLALVGGANLVVGAIALHLLRIGYKIRG